MQKRKLSIIVKRSFHRVLPAMDPPLPPRGTSYEDFKLIVQAHSVYMNRLWHQSEMTRKRVVALEQKVTDAIATAVRATAATAVLQHCYSTATAATAATAATVQQPHQHTTHQLE
eukprot:740985-Prymnesium_polylepis.2